jgi:16S rRNA (guanine527-N7)-methyltransferase
MESVTADRALQRRLEAGLERIPLTLSSRRRQRLLAYLDELLRWNRSVNLTAVRDPMEAVDRHLLDSLAIAPHLATGAALDAGSGGGLPGIPLAIAAPMRRWTLVDSNGKKVRFLRHVVRQLALTHVQVRQARLEALVPDALDQAWRPVQLVTRAFAPLPRQCDWAAPWLDAGVRLLAMVGTLDRAELDALPVEVEVEAVHDLGHAAMVPAARHLVVLRRAR